MTATLDRCLEDLASRIDEDAEAKHRDAWLNFVNDDHGEGCFVPPIRTPNPPKTDWPEVNVNDALHDTELMLIQQFKAVSNVLEKGEISALTVRCNYGVSIMASQWGCEVIEMPRDQGDLPTPAALPSRDAVRSAIESGIPTLDAGQGADVWTAAHAFQDALDRYPVLGRWVHLIHPDGQGPIDNAELLLGSDMFIAMIDEPELVLNLVEALTEQYIGFFKKWFELVPRTDGLGRGMSGFGPYRGTVMIREDSLMNISADMYEEFALTADQRVLDELGGGSIHFCGRGDHFIESLSKLKGLSAINLTQPHLNEMDTIYEYTVDKGILLLGMPRAECERALTQGTDLRGRVQTSL